MVGGWGEEVSGALSMVSRATLPPAGMAHTLPFWDMFSHFITLGGVLFDLVLCGALRGMN